MSTDLGGLVESDVIAKCRRLNTGDSITVSVRADLPIGVYISRLRNLLAADETTKRMTFQFTGNGRDEIEIRRA